MSNHIMVIAPYPSHIQSVLVVFVENCVLWTD